jgi:hypothetical protein
MFVVFINDIDKAVKCVETIKKFANDTKIRQKMTSQTYKQKFQQAPDNLCKWSDKWSTEFNIPICQVMHLLHENPGHKITMRGTVLQEIKEEKYTRVTIMSNLRLSMQRMRAAKTFQAVLGQITQAFHYRYRYIFVQLYKQYV